MLLCRKFLPTTLFAAWMIMMTLNPIQLIAQGYSEKGNWTIGLKAGVLSSSIPTGSSATNIVSSRLNIKQKFYTTAGINIGYDITDYESIELLFTTGKFSVLTNYELWPELIFKNKFYTGSFNTRFRLKRMFEFIPDQLDPYGMFGLGLMHNSHSASMLDTNGSSQLLMENDQSSGLSFLFTLGAGIDIPLSDRISILLHYDYNTVNRDLIDKNLAGEILNNDFIQTTNKWSTFKSGIRIRFGKSKSVQSPELDDFSLISENEEGAEGLDSEVDLIVIEKIKLQPTISSETVVADEDSTLSETALPDTNQDIEEVDVPEIQNTAQADSISQPTYGLYGENLENLTIYWTMVIHSLNSLESAEKTAFELKGEGFRVTIQPAIVNQKEYFRIGIGQFENRQSARNAADDLPEPYHNNYFLIQIE